jgi:glycosidase
MQWDDTEPNAGFSTAAPDDLYLPEDPDPHRPTVRAQSTQEGSTLNRVQRLIQLRRHTPELRTTSPTQILAAGYPLVYQRGDHHLIVINPAGTTRKVDIAALRSQSPQPSRSTASPSKAPTWWPTRSGTEFSAFDTTTRATRHQPLASGVLSPRVTRGRTDPD